MLPKAVGKSHSFKENLGIDTESLSSEIQTHRNQEGQVLDRCQRHGSQTNKTLEEARSVLTQSIGNENVRTRPALQGGWTEKSYQNPTIGGSRDIVWSTESLLPTTPLASEARPQQDEMRAAPTFSLFNDPYTSTTADALRQLSLRKEYISEPAGPEVACGPIDKVASIHSNAECTCTYSKLCHMEQNIGASANEHASFSSCTTPPRFEHYYSSGDIVPETFHSTDMHAAPTDKILLVDCQTIFRLIRTQSKNLDTPDVEYHLPDDLLTPAYLRRSCLFPYPPSPCDVTPFSLDITNK